MANPDLTKQRNAAESLCRQYKEQVDAIRANPHLSDEGRQRHVAAAFEATKKQLQERAEAEREILSSRHEKLEKKVYGQERLGWEDDATHAMNVRDCADRAAKLGTPDEATAALRRAEGNDDAMMARAIARHCMDQSTSSMGRRHASQWEDVFRIYLDRRPDLQPIVDELGEIEDLQTPALISPYRLGPPPGIEQRYLNEAQSGRNPEPPARKSTGPLLDPSKNATTREQREDWNAAIGVQA